MPERFVYHVVPHEKHAARIWKVEHEGKEAHGGSEHVLRIFITKKDAVDHAKDIASRNCPSQVIVHSSDGRFEEEFTF